MNSEIKRLLKLSNIPGFRLMPQEQRMLDEWKNAQEPLQIKKPARKKRVKNVVTAKEKTEN